MPVVQGVDLGDPPEGAKIVVPRGSNYRALSLYPKDIEQLNRTKSLTDAHNVVMSEHQEQLGHRERVERGIVDNISPDAHNSAIEYLAESGTRLARRKAEYDAIIGDGNGQKPSDERQLRLAYEMMESFGQKPRNGTHDLSE